MLILTLTFDMWDTICRILFREDDWAGRKPLSEIDKIVVFMVEWEIW